MISTQGQLHQVKQFNGNKSYSVLVNTCLKYDYKTVSCRILLLTPLENQRSCVFYYKRRNHIPKLHITKRLYIYKYKLDIRNISLQNKLQLLIESTLI